MCPLPDRDKTSCVVLRPNPNQAESLQSRRGRTIEVQQGWPGGGAQLYSAHTFCPCNCFPQSARGRGREGRHRILLWQKEKCWASAQKAHHGACFRDDGSPPCPLHFPCLCTGWQNHSEKNIGATLFSVCKYSTGNSGRMAPRVKPETLSALF